MSIEDGPEKRAAVVVAVRPSRRWWLVLVAVLALPCSASVGLAAWFVKGTIDAGRGAETPLAAVYGVMGGVDRWADEDLGDTLRFMSSERRDQVRARVRELRRQLVEQPFGAVVELGRSQTAMQADDHARLTVDVRVVVDVGGGLFARSEWHPWVFDTVNEHGLVSSGWKVDAISGPDLCGPYLRCSG